ncbi:hypothetical protein GCM10009560_05190 [Nonomuraea longicatena]|uniref:Uncharacterized protein n=1 Tax=Nonomuraea longicatena TaxID=83682 RepID=A0ABP3Z4H3_9ACTN
MTRLLSAQAVIQAVSRRTNLLIAGKRVALLTDTPALASRLRAMGAHPGTALAEADLVIGDGVDPDSLKPGAIVAGTLAPGAAPGARVRDGVTRHRNAHGHEIFAVDLAC